MQEGRLPATVLHEYASLSVLVLSFQTSALQAFFLLDKRVPSPIKLSVRFKLY